MTVNRKKKTINNKIKQNKSQYDLDREMAKILVLSSGSIGKYEFLTDFTTKYQKKLLTIKRFEY